MSFSQVPYFSLSYFWCKVKHSQNIIEAVQNFIQPKTVKKTFDLDELEPISLIVKNAIKQDRNPRSV